MTREPRDAPQFYLTAPSPCPYLPDREERKVFTHLIGRKSPTLNDSLTQSGFRRSQTIAYRPACERCRGCVSVRVLVDEFELSRNLRRVRDQNADLIGAVTAPKATSEQYSLFRTYLDQRHSDGGMADMTVLDYAMMIEDSIVDTFVTEYRLKPEDGDSSYRQESWPLMAVALTDRLSDGLSMVYSFYNPAEDWRSLGTYMVLDHIEQARSRGLPYDYLGYWIEGSQKMAYKARFTPLEARIAAGWVPLKRP